MRDLGEVSQALLTAAQALASPGRGPTLQELSHRACVSVPAAKAAVQNLKRAGRLRIARHRPVEYRNRPVAEYELAPSEAAEPANELDRAMVLWVQR